jgi:hypothetical protein
MNTSIVLLRTYIVRSIRYQQDRQKSPEKINVNPFVPLLLLSGLVTTRTLSFIFHINKIQRTDAIEKLEDG